MSFFGTGKQPADIKIYYIVLNWFAQILTTTVLWYILCNVFIDPQLMNITMSRCARVSIIVTINRVVTPWRALKRITALVPFLFLAFYGVVISEKIWVCSRSAEWHTSNSVQCFLADPIPVTELSCTSTTEFSDIDELFM